MRKYSIFKVFVLALLIYLIYKVVAYFLLDTKITIDNTQPAIKISELLNISEKRVDYRLNYYVDKKFIGFNAFIDKKYSVSVVKLGNISSDFKIIPVSGEPKGESNFNLLPFSDIEDRNGRYIDLHHFPFDITQIYYYSFSNGHIDYVNESHFYEIEGVFPFFNISFGNKDKRDFGFGGYQGKQSVSFIVYNNDLFVLNLTPRSSFSYKSLHTLSNTFD